MLAHFLAFAMNHPRGVEAAGNVTCRVAGSVLALGLLLRALAGVMASLPGAQGQVTAAQFFPGLPTWWIPEGPAGVAGWAFVFGCGVAAMLAGRELRRLKEAY